MHRVEVCFSPADFHLYEQDFECVVVIDVLRATSAICAALAHGVDRIVPVGSVEEAREWQARGVFAAAERDGMVVDGFELGNSPLGFIARKEVLAGKPVVLTTTNGTKAIRMAEHKRTVAIGSLLNLSALCDFLVALDEPVLILGAGWKDKFNLEDTICGGAIVDRLLETGRFKNRRRQLGRSEIHLPLSAGQHVRLPARLLAPQAAPEVEFECRCKVLPDA